MTRLQALDTSTKLEPRERTDEAERIGAEKPSRRAGRGLATRLVLFAIAVAIVLGARPATFHARAASLLVSFADPAAKVDVRDERTTFVRDGVVVPARIFSPAQVFADTPGVVLVHGVHHGGIEEPRLERFARAVASVGLVVMTPAVTELSDYAVAPRSIDTVGAAIDDLRARRGHARVGVMGMSFGGGVALLAASDPRFAEHVAFVVAVGAHDDLGRVSRFFATNAIAPPDGGPVSLRAHEYGATVLVYSHAADFFPPEDVPAAREALRLWLWEKRDEARVAARPLGAASKEKVERLFAADLDPLRDELLAAIAKRKDEMDRVSPHGHLAGLRANVYLLHGAGDTVIPAIETLHLANDVPPARLRAVLVSPAIVHVELKEPNLSDQWALVHFMGDVLAETRGAM